ALTRHFFSLFPTCTSHGQPLREKNNSYILIQIKNYSFTHKKFDQPLAIAIRFSFHHACACPWRACAFAASARRLSRRRRRQRPDTDGSALAMLLHSQR